MAINEVYFGDTQLISLKNDTVATANDIMVGKIGHLNSGDIVTGTATNDATITVGNNNTSSHLLSSETAYANGHKITGTMVNRGSGTAALTTKNATYNISEGYYNGTGNITIASSAIADCVEEKIKSGSTILGVSGSFTSDATATAADILGGDNPKTAYVNGNKITGIMPNNGSMTAELSTKTATKIIPAGYTSGGTVSILTSEQNKIIGENIKSGINILGTNGTFTNDATATAANILLDKTAYVNGNKITGTMPDYTSFPLYCQNVQHYTVTLNANTGDFPLQAFNLNGNPIKYILIFCANSMSGIGRSTAGTSSPFISFISYSYNKSLFYSASGTPYKWLCSANRIGYNSSGYAYFNNFIRSDETNYSIVNEAQLSSGNAIIRSPNPSTSGYFMKDVNYFVFIGG